MMRFLLPLLLLIGLRAPAEIVNSSVGQVGDHVVTAREIWVSNFLERWSLARRASDKSLRIPKPDWKPSLNSEAFHQAASSFMLEVMVAKEAENFSVAKVDEGTVKEDASEFLKSAGTSPEWTKLEVSGAELEKFIERKYRAQNFLKFKTDSAGVVIADDEAKTYFEKNRLKFGNLPFSQFKESIKEVLSRQRLEERLKDWFEVLRRKYRVRFLGKAET